MIGKRLTQIAESSAMRYASLCEGWQLRFDQALIASRFGFADHIQGVVTDCYALAETFLADEREHVTRIVAEIASDAHRQTKAEISSNDSDELSPSALTHLGEMERYVADELIAQIHRDVAMVRRALSKIQLEVTTTARSRGITERQAQIEYRINNSENLKFMFHDRYARKWSSKKFVRGMWRHSLLQTYNEIVLMTLADHGLQRAAIMDRTGQVIEIVAIAFEPQLFSYADVVSDYFHPNSDAYLAMEPASV